MSDMYEFVDGTFNPLLGQCLHECQYCYVRCKLGKRWKSLADRYSGPLRIDSRALSGKSKPKSGRVFLCSCNDLFQEKLRREDLAVVLDIADRYPKTHWLTQSKNPERMIAWTERLKTHQIGTTIEGDSLYASSLSKAPPIASRLQGIRRLTELGMDTFITIEPVVSFSKRFHSLLMDTGVRTINIGADSGKNGLLEPSKKELEELIFWLGDAGISVHLKKNISRLMGWD